MEMSSKNHNKENEIQNQGELSPISKLMQNYKEDPLECFHGLAISSPNRELFGPPPSMTPSFGKMKPFNPYLS
jgi:hypothetical protein